MTERELSQRLDELATKLDEAVESDDSMWWKRVQEVASDLRKLSGEKYTPGHTSWDDVKKQAKPVRNKFPF